MVGSGKWKNIFFCPFLGLSRNGIRVHHVVTTIHACQYLLWPCTMGSLLSHVHHRNCPMLVDIHVHQYLYILFVFPHCGCQVTPHPSLYVTLLLFNFLFKSSASSVCLV